MRVKVKVWIEDDNNNLVFGSGKSEILEIIDQKGSISDASKELNINYKKTWSHIKILENFIEDELVIVQKGRGQNSGTKLTQKAKEIVEKYNRLEKDIKEYSNNRFKELFLEDSKEIFCTKSKTDV